MLPMGDAEQKKNQKKPMMQSVSWAATERCVSVEHQSAVRKLISSFFLCKAKKRAETTDGSGLVASSDLLVSTRPRHSSRALILRWPRLSSASPRFKLSPQSARWQMNGGQEKPSAVAEAASSVSSLSERQISSSASSVERKQEIDFLIPQSCARHWRAKANTCEPMQPSVCVCVCIHSGFRLSTRLVDWTAAVILVTAVTQQWQ